MYSYLGWSVIPLLGDAAPDTPKVPAVPWSAYQSRRASPAELRHWFIDKGYQGLGLVTGRVSGLVVLDFDSVDLFEAFSRAYPDLVQCAVIRTRRGYHVHFLLPPALSITTRKGKGVDLLAGGCYAVARPTVIDGFAYTAVKGGMPHKLTAQDIGRIYHFMDQHTPRRGEEFTPISSTSRGREQMRRVDDGQEALQAHIDEKHSLTPADVEGLYRGQVAQGRGRNQALFQTALIARDYGWSQADVLEVLVDPHITMPAPPSHAAERAEGRRQEAVRTVESVYSRPARPARPLPHVSRQLPTRLREKLHGLDLTGFIRVVELLREKDVLPGQTFTRKQAYDLLRGQVGRDTLDAVLKGCAPDGQALFEGAATPSGHPPASEDAAAGSQTPATKKCFFGRATNSGKMSRGRKARRFTMPGNTALCQRFGVPLSGSDPLQPEDFHSAKKTRQAVHREFIKRRPGSYARRWLAKRLGVSVRTLQRYNHELHITVSPMYHDRAITWYNLNDVPDEAVPGLFLEDETHRRYPALQTLAAKLLREGHTVMLRRQDVNFYSLDAPAVMFSQIAARKRAQQQQTRSAVETQRSEHLPPVTPRPAIQSRSGPPPPSASIAVPYQPVLLPMPSHAPQTQPQPQAHLTKRRARQPLPNPHEEAVVRRVCNHINQRTARAEDRISQASARQWVTAYGVPAVEAALRVLASRRAISSPAGFVFTLLRAGNPHPSPRRS